MAHLFMDRCDLYAVDTTVARGRLGSTSKTAEKIYDQDIHCTFLQEGEKVKNDQKGSDMTLIESFVILFPRDVVVAERMIVRNVRLRNGSVIADGPFLIERLIAHRSLGKLINHRSAYLKKDFSLEGVTA